MNEETKNVIRLAVDRESAIHELGHFVEYAAQGCRCDIVLCDWFAPAAWCTPHPATLPQDPDSVQRRAMSGEAAVALLCCDEYRLHLQLGDAAFLEVRRGDYPNGSEWPVTWQKDTEVFAATMGNASGGDLDELQVIACQRCYPLLRLHQTSILKIANLLVERRRMSAEEIEAEWEGPLPTRVCEPTPDLTPTAAADPEARGEEPILTHRLGKIRL